MPTVTADALRRIGQGFFVALGCRPDDAQIVADHLVQSSLYGHDSHGTLRMYEYARAVSEGRVIPDRSPEVVSEHTCTAVIDANDGFGQVGATLAANMAIEKARQHGLASVALRRASHIGRAGEYPAMIARAGLLGMAYVNFGRLGIQVAPFGGIDGRLGTNPLAFAAPRRADPPIMVDMTTSTVADGKIRVATNLGKPLPAGWIVDKEGNPSTDPQDYFSDPRGAILPLGGPLGHKGYALAMMMELCAGGLSGQGMAAGDARAPANAALFTAYDIGHFADMDFYYDEVEAMVRHVKSSRTATGVEEILLPGEPEFRTERERERAGIPIDDTTWEKVCAAARDLSLDPTAWKLT
ncbi:MAG: Ldh family oxidoreductase [Chloroflexota bacterium]|nr:Ldh family oxidoreductase [Chloroflexota bacterium]MDE2930199.1 Ldh family oxidoreductase [Chloroflexota bacterium]